MLTEGDKAPNFTLKNQKGEEVNLQDILDNGKYVALYFYPKDNTPGCTTQGCLFRDLQEEFEDNKCIILGVSADSVDSHNKFAEKHDFNFDILADADGEVSQKYGVLTKVNLLVKKFNKISRSTFLVNPQGEIVKVWEKASPATNAREVLKLLRNLD
jgi:peroxiredoxin Q/BCP